MNIETITDQRNADEALRSKDGGYAQGYRDGFAAGQVAGVKAFDAAMSIINRPSVKVDYTGVQCTCTDPDCKLDHT